MKTITLYADHAYPGKRLWALSPYLRDQPLPGPQVEALLKGADTKVIEVAELFEKCRTETAIYVYLTHQKNEDQLKAVFDNILQAASLCVSGCDELETLCLVLAMFTRGTVSLEEFSATGPFYPEEIEAIIRKNRLVDSEIANIQSLFKVLVWLAISCESPKDEKGYMLYLAYSELKNYYYRNVRNLAVLSQSMNFESGLKKTIVAT